MAKRGRGFDDKKMEKWIKEGRGRGIGKDYKPWLTIHDVTSTGREVRIPGIKSGRLHHFLSDMERDYYFILEFSDDVVDIREQYPLLYREETEIIAKYLGIKHPTDPNTQCHVVMTTDFLITVKRGNQYIQLARTIKGKDGLLNERQIEKFEIERRYWKTKGIDWGIVTEDQINKTVAENISLIYDSYEIIGHDCFSNISGNLIQKLISDFKQEILGQDVIVREITAEFDRRMDLKPGTSLSIYKHLIATKQIRINLLKKYGVDDPQKVELYTKHELTGVSAG